MKKLIAIPKIMFIALVAVFILLSYTTYKYGYAKGRNEEQKRCIEQSGLQYKP